MKTLRWALLASLPFLGAICLAEVFLGRSPKEDRLRQELLQALPRPENLVGRIVGSLPDGQQREAVDLRAIAKRVETEVQSGHVQALADFAILELLAGEPSKAVTALEKSISLVPTDARFQSDLSVALLTRGGATNQPLDIVRAFDLADRAVRLSGRREALFNRGIALEKLALYPAARRSWNAYLKRDDNTVWADKARRRWQICLAREALPRLSFERAGLELAISQNHLDTALGLARQFPRATQTWVEDHLLRQWAKAYIAADQREAARIISISKAVADVVQAVSQDAFLGATIESLADSRERSTMALLARGHELYSSGRDVYTNGKYREAAKLFRRSLLLLRRISSPFSLRAEFAMGCALFYDGDQQGALEVFRGVAEKATEHQYRTLEADARWMEGLASFARGDLGRAFSAYREALSTARVLHDPGFVAGIDSLLAELLDYQGATEEAWNYGREALEIAADLGDAQRRYLIYAVMATVSFNAGQEELALELQKEVLAAARRLDNPGALATALFWRARYELKCKHLHVAAAALREALGVAAHMPSESEKTRVVGDLLLASAEIQMETQPRLALRMLSEALRNQHAAEAIYHEISLYVVRAKLYKRLGERTSAREDLKSAIRLIERHREGIAERRLRRSFIDSERAAYQELVDLLMEDALPEDALEVLERSRARGWLDALMERSDRALSARPLTFWQIRASVPKGVVVIEYALHQDRLWVWAVTREGLCKTGSVAWSLMHHRALRSMRGALENQRFDARAERAAKSLYEVLVGNFLTAAPEHANVVLVPDSELYTLPFAALKNPATNIFLIEERVLSMALSASGYIAGAARQRRLPQGIPQRALLVADVVIDRKHHPDLGSLPGAEREAGEMRAIYPRLDLLVGQEATKENVLRQAPHADLVQISTHALSQPSSSVSSYFVLTPSGSGVDFDRLSAAEVETHDLSRVRIAVLSACRTATGLSWKSSDGPDSLTRSFLHAGVPVVVGSLWPVRDDLLPDVLAHFHHHLRAGEAPAMALQSAQVELLRSLRGSGGPSFDWAALQVYGGVTEK